MRAGKISRTEQMIFLVIGCLILVGSGFRLWFHQDELILQVEPVLWAAEDNDRHERQAPMEADEFDSSNSPSQLDSPGSVEEGMQGEESAIDGTLSSQRVQEGEVSGPDQQGQLRSQEQLRQQGHKVNINIASSEELMSLPGIGPVLAGRILEYREHQGPFIDIEQLMEVKGIGVRTLARLRPLVTVKNAETFEDQ